MEKSVTLPLVTLYSDGACSGNPGPGGYASILLYKKADGETVEREFSEGFLMTTNNRMELMAVIIGLEKLNRPCRVEVWSDSAYVCNAFNQHWVDGWKKAGFRRGKADEVKNIDLWERLLRAMSPHKVNFNWIKGHAGNEYNERCDRLAVKAYENLKIKESDKEEE